VKLEWESVMRVLLTTGALLAALSGASAETLVISGIPVLDGRAPAIVCSRLSSAKIVSESLRQGRVEALEGCWKVAIGTEVVELNADGDFTWVAVKQGNWSRAWTDSRWVRAK
jgi:hypothetical protein